MKKVIEYLNNNQPKKIINQQIRVYGWQKEYDHQLVSSVSNYLFEDLNRIEHIVEVNEDNRPGKVKPNFYITVHDTGDSAAIHTAKFWSDAVYNHSFTEDGKFNKYLCSYQYVVGNDGVYHNLPDNEVAYHAGDTTKFDYKLYKASVQGNNEDPVITISEDGFYEIDGKKSEIAAPRVYREKNSEVVEDRLPTTNDLNDQSVLCKLIDGEYYIGETYYSASYRLIANRGGNNNSVGIESCINEDTDIYFTWQRTAKLVAHLLDENNLTMKDIKQHHYFSGKNCPQTIRMNGMWPHFLELVKFERDMLEFKKEGYKFELICNDERVDAVGRITSVGTEAIKYTIKVSKDNETAEYNGIIEVK